MRLIRFACLALLLLPAGRAVAAPVVVLDGDRSYVRDDPSLAGVPLWPGPQDGRVGSTPAPAAASTAARRRTVLRELRRLYYEGAMKREVYAKRRDTYRRAKKVLKRLKGRRRIELGAVIGNLDSITARGGLTPSRLHPLFQTLDSNLDWWTEGPLLRPGQRVTFEGSTVVWQYYPGQGIELQMLANFGKANWYWAHGRDGTMRRLLNRLIALGVRRAGGTAWEYYFRFGGGRPPWTSAISQGTAVQALARATQRLGDPKYVQAARDGLGVFHRAPRTGVRVQTDVGAHYLIYSFSPSLRVLNAFAQSLVGLYDLATLGPDPDALLLFQQGDAEARREVPRYDTGAWSLYDGRRESDLNYHELVTDFLQALCDRVAAPVYCDTAQRFRHYLKEPPRIDLLTRRVRGGRRAALRFRLSKISRVGAVISRGGRTVFATSANVSRGTHSYGFTAPRRAGRYEVRLRARDLAGNVRRTTSTIRVLKPRRS